MRSVARWTPPTAAVLALVALGGCGDEATSPHLDAASAKATAAAVGTTGNGAPSGAHYTLNIIGVPKDKSVSFDGGSGHRIFVGLGKVVKEYIAALDMIVLAVLSGVSSVEASGRPVTFPSTDGVTIAGEF